MFLKEFFSKPIDIDVNQKTKSEQTQSQMDDLFWFIVDHDKLHKDYFFPVARQIKKMKECTESEVLEMFMPMVIKGCKEFYIHENMKGKLSKCFPKDLREDICKRLYDHYVEDIKAGKYNLG